MSIIPTAEDRSYNSGYWSGRLEALREAFALVRPLGLDGNKARHNLRHELATMIAAQITRAEAQSLTGASTK
jgi:hypothetical protein